MLKAFTRNYEDNSTEAGFQFTFYCDLCQDGFKSSFMESETYKKGSLLRGISGGARVVGNLFGSKMSNLGWSLSHGGDVLSERFTGMSPEWHKEHDKAFEMAQNEARHHFNRCHNCRQWVCDSDFNEDECLCVECAPRVNVKVVKARSDRMMEEIQEGVQGNNFFIGKIESKTIICPTCNKPSGEGKFCNNCGASLALNVCPGCGTKLAAGTKFCGTCGAKV